MLRLQTNIDRLTAQSTEDIAKIQARLDRIEPDAKEQMKRMALGYLAAKAKAQSHIDNDGVDL